jgi:hypothetical protein
MAGATRRIGVEERRARLVRRHRLVTAARAGTPVEVARDMVALHGTDPATVFLSAAARMRVRDIGAIERALYEDRALVRMLGMRRTMFVVPVELVPVVQAACTRAIAVRERRRNVELVEKAGLAADGAAWLAQTEAGALRALAARGEATGAELAAEEPRLREQIMFAEGKSYGGPGNMTTRVLFVLSAEGRIVRGRPRGSWTSSQYRWSLAERWLPGGIPAEPTEDAQVELATAWLARYGPGTLADLKWWTGWTAGETKRALAKIGPVEVDLDGQTGLVLPDDVDPGGSESGQETAPELVLLPALDPTVMGWSVRDWYLGPHGPALFDRTGNAGPTVWWGGRIVGGWAQRADGEIAFRLLEDVGREAADAAAAASAALQAWLGPVRVATPRGRGRCPVEQELIA